MSDVFDVEERAERGAYNQALFREVNEKINALVEDPQIAAEFGAPPPQDPDWVCECANGGCMGRLTMSRGAYAAVRAAPSRFLVLPADSHVFVDIEEVVGRQQAYWVVEKTGRAKVIAEDLYERWHG